MSLVYLASGRTWSCDIDQEASQTPYGKDLKHLTVDKERTKFLSDLACN